MASDLLETFGRHLSAGSGFQNPRGDVGARPDITLADVVENRAQKRGSGGVEHEMPHAESPILAQFFAFGIRNIELLISRILGIGVHGDVVSWRSIGQVAYGAIPNNFFGAH
ncbi:hypothetical protein IVB42_19005 [Bradyrhizobium sp. 45]|nr:hypothetical protein [Bradyrhizobium sp. 45]